MKRETVRGRDRMRSRRDGEGQRKKRQGEEWAGTVVEELGEW